MCRKNAVSFLVLRSKSIFGTVQHSYFFPSLFSSRVLSSSAIAFRHISTSPSAALMASRTEGLSVVVIENLIALDAL